MQFAQKLLSTRGGTIVLSLAAAALAAVILITYLHRYRESVRASNVEVPVLVAKGVISKGTSGDIIAAQGLYQVSDRERADVVDGAITDPATLKGRVATEDIYPGEQLTAAKLGVSTSTSLSNRISGDERAVTVPIEAAHGMIGQLQVGDHVDVYAGFNVQNFRLGGSSFVEEGPERAVLKLISSDVLVLGVPTSGSRGLGSGGGKTQLILRLSDRQAANAAFAADNGVLWVTLRPRANASAPSPSIVSVETLLFGVPAVKVYKSLGGQ